MELLIATYETIKMTAISLFFAYVFGLPLGILTNETDDSGMLKCKPIHMLFEFIIGFGRAIPFTILMVLVLPFTRLLIGTGIGSTACIVLLVL